MVISPKEARQLTKEERYTLSRLERKIDLALKSGDRTFVSDLLGSERVSSEIERKYRAAGWKIEYILDQRDGNYYVFRGGRK